MQRPMGVTILAILAAVGGIARIIEGIGLIGFGLLGAVVSVATGVAASFLAGGFAVVWGVLIIILASVYLVLAYGAWFLKPWAWLVGVGVAGLTVLVALVNLIGGRGFGDFVIAVAIAGAILYYLFTPEIKKVFGRV